MTGTIWEQVLGRIETKVNNHTYLTWFENTSLLRDSGSSILVQVGDPMAVDWMNKHYSGLIAEALSEVGRPGASFSFLPGRQRNSRSTGSSVDAEVERRRGTRSGF
jgi:chromosomal replication initiation ATPase DnaA